MNHPNKCISCTNGVYVESKSIKPTKFLGDVTVVSIICNTCGHDYTDHLSDLAEEALDKDNPLVLRVYNFDELGSPTNYVIGPMSIGLLKPRTSALMYVHVNDKNELYTGSTGEELLNNIALGNKESEFDMILSDIFSEYKDSLWKSIHQ